MWNHQPYFFACCTLQTSDYTVTCSCFNFGSLANFTESRISSTSLATSSSSLTAFTATSTLVPSTSSSPPSLPITDVITNGKVKKRSKRYKCPACSYESVEKAKLTRHQRMHAGSKPFKCPSCQYESYDKSKIRRHYVTHTRDKPFKCELCGSRFTQSGSLKTHLTNVHKMDRVEFLCPFCSELVTTNMGELRNHVKTLHDSTEFPVIVNKANHKK